MDLYGRSMYSHISNAGGGGALGSGNHGSGVSGYHTNGYGYHNQYSPPLHQHYQQTHYDYPGSPHHHHSGSHHHGHASQYMDIASADPWYLNHYREQTGTTTLPSLATGGGSDPWGRGPVSPVDMHP